MAEGELLSNDNSVNQKKKLHEVDEKVINTAKTGYGAIPITSVEQLQALAEAAKKTYDNYSEAIRLKMTPERAALIRKLRVEDGCSWRAVAADTFENWGEDAGWVPSSNQLAGMALCEHAANMLGEDSREAPWN